MPARHHHYDRGWGCGTRGVRHQEGERGGPTRRQHPTEISFSSTHRRRKRIQRSDMVAEARGFGIGARNLACDRTVVLDHGLFKPGLDARYMNSVAGPRGSATACRWTTAPGAVALLPVFNIPDRAIIAYEALPRLTTPDDRLSVVRSALEMARHTAPAVLLVPMFGDVLYGAGIDPAKLAAEHGARASDVAWVISARPVVTTVTPSKTRSPNFGEPDSWSP